MNLISSICSDLERNEKPGYSQFFGEAWTTSHGLRMNRLSEDSVLAHLIGPGVQGLRFE